MNQDIKTLAKEVEIWLANLRYVNNDINCGVSLADISTLSDIFTGKKIYSNSIEKIKIIVDYYKILYPVPEEIRNRLLCLLAFREENKKIKYKFGPAPKIGSYEGWRLV